MLALALFGGGVGMMPVSQIAAFFLFGLMGLVGLCFIIAVWQEEQRDNEIATGLGEQLRAGTQLRYKKESDAWGKEVQSWVKATDDMVRAKLSAAHSARFMAVGHQENEKFFLGSKNAITPEQLNQHVTLKRHIAALEKILSEHQSKST